jgi:hypothetical protein
LLRDGTLACLPGSYAPGHGGLRVIFSTDGGHTWVAPAKDHGFLVDNAYGYGKAMELPDGSLFITYLSSGGHRTQDARNARFAASSAVAPIILAWICCQLQPMRRRILKPGLLRENLDG